MNDQELIRQTIVIHNKLSDCEKLFDLLNKFIKAHNVDDETFNDIKLAAEETFANIVNYAYPDNKTYNITAELNISSNKISLTFTDAGVAFNPLSDSAKSFNEERLDEGGMGIPIIRSLTDHQQYNRIDEHNVFTITKHYTQQH